jgi:hypothetical protein
MVRGYARLDFGPGWETTNHNLIELVDLFDGDKLDWAPKGEWSARVIYGHLIAARYHGPIPGPDDLARFNGLFAKCATAAGIKEELFSSWAMLASFLSDEARLDALYEDGAVAGDGEAAPASMGSVERAAAGLDLGYVDRPERYTGHYIAYHRFAHDLHHRSTLVGYLSELGVTLDGRRIRPL